MATSSLLSSDERMKLLHQQQQQQLHNQTTTNQQLRDKHIYSSDSNTYSRPDTLSFTISMSGKKGLFSPPEKEVIKSKNDSPTSLDSALASSRGSNSSIRQTNRSRVSGSHKASFSSRRSSSSESSDSDFEHLDMPTPSEAKTNKGLSTSPTPPTSIVKPCNRYGWFIDSDEAQDQEVPLPPEVIKRREAKWIEMTSNERRWNNYVTKRFRTLRKRCRKGIPHSVRARAWFYLCGGHKSMDRQRGLFARLDALPGEESINDEISKDLHRQFPSHELFATRDGSGQQDLYRILKAYSILKPEVGYCQGQAPLAAVLLMIMPAEQAFLSLSNLCDLYLQGYFDPGLETLQLHGDMLFSLLRRYYPSAHKLLKKQKIEPVLYMTEWFMCLFSRTLPWPVVLRVWDMFMCEGIIIIFKVAIVIVGSVLDGEKKNCKQMYDTLQFLKNPPKKYLSEKNLLPRIHRLDLTETDLKREHAIQSNNRRIKRIAEEKRKLAALSEVEKARQHHQKLQSSVSSSYPSSHSRDLPARNGGNSYRSQSKQNGGPSPVVKTTTTSSVRSQTVKKTVSSPPVNQDYDSRHERYSREPSIRKSSSPNVSRPSVSPAPRDSYRLARGDYQKEKSPTKSVVSR